jgi:predicted GNAT superfamily acetyltransferase
VNPRENVDMTSLRRVLEGGVVLRRAETPADYRACQDAQRKAWGITEDGYVIPVATMVGANLHGGLVLGAFEPDGAAVAMSFAFLGRVEGRICLYSQLTGVVPGRQSLGLGREMKLLQRDFARADGLSTIAWAFDPLQSGNARFNIAKLGARVRRYVDDMYGPRTDALNAGVPTDRVIAEWDVRGPFEPAGDPGGAPSLIAIRDGLPTAIPASAGEALWLPVPRDAAALRRDRPEAAEAWRKAVRQAMTSAFDAGYEAAGFLRDPEPRCGYILRRATRIDGAAGERT